VVPRRLAATADDCDQDARRSRTALLANRARLARLPGPAPPHRLGLARRPRIAGEQFQQRRELCPGARLSAVSGEHGRPRHGRTIVDVPSSDPGAIPVTAEMSRT